MHIDFTIVDEHEQKYPKSCIASAIEIILKLIGEVDTNYYDVQDNWKNEDNRLSFADFHNRKIEGVRFERKFSIDRSKSFPFKELFETIDCELAAGRYVVISLVANNGWHMWVIYKKKDNDFSAVSKSGKTTIHLPKLKDQVQRMGGTDILVYRYDN